METTMITKAEEKQNARKPGLNGSESIVAALPPVIMAGVFKLRLQVLEL